MRTQMVGTCATAVLVMFGMTPPVKVNASHIFRIFIIP